MPLSNDNRTFGIALKITYKPNDADDTDITEEHYQEFNYATTAKQGVCLTVTPEISNKIIETVAFAFVYGYNRNTMTVENAMLNFAYDIATGTNENTYDGNSQQTTETEAEILSETLDKETVSTDKEYMLSSTAYDSTGTLVTSQTDEAGNKVSYGYDSLGNQTSVTDAKGNTTSYSYDKLGNLTSIVSGNASNTYTYDDQFRLSSISHNEFAYNFNYDIYGQLIDAKVGDQSLVSYTYNYRGLLTSMTYGNGDVINYTYDNFDRVITVGRGNSVFAILTYNKKGLVSRVYDDELYESTYYDYDIQGNLISKISTNWNNDFAYGMSTDKDGNTVEIINIEGKYTTITSGINDKGDSFVNYHGVSVKNESDDLGRKATVITKFDNGTQDTTNDDYTTLDTTYDYVSGTATNSTTNLVEKITHTYGENTDEIYQYEYDANGNIIEVIHTLVTELEDESTTQTEEITVAEYEYDSLNQLTVAKDKKENTYTEYTYDDAGNIIKKSVWNTDPLSGNVVGNATEYTYDYDETWKDKLSSYNGTTITYDEIGNPIDYRNGISMAWDKGRQLQSFTKDNVTTTYKYNSDGMRTCKNSSDGNTQYYYDANNNLIALCYTPTTGTKKVLNFFYDSEGSPVSFQVNSLEKYFYVKNLQGDIEKIVDVFGEVLVTYTYDAWGNILDVTDNSTNNLSTLNPLRYRGYAYDTESGFYYLQSRYYDPQTGRFLNADETQYLGATKTALSCNLFAYCENNPIINTDSTGCFSVKVVLIAGIAGGIWNFTKYTINNFRNFSLKNAFKYFLAGFATGALLGALIQLPKAITFGLIGAVTEILMYVGQRIGQRSKLSAKTLLNKALVGFSMGIMANSVRCLVGKMGYSYTKVRNYTWFGFVYAFVQGLASGYLTKFFSIK